MEKIRILKRPEVESMTGLSRSSIYLKMANGSFPPNIKLGAGARAVGWLESDVQQWLSDCITTSRGTM